MNKYLLEQIKLCVEKFGTPVYLYDADKIISQVNSLKKLIDIGVSVHYSMKANPNLSVLKLFAKLGICCEVSSKNELNIALLAGFDAEKIIFVGPGKTKAELDLAIRKGIKYIICESFNEIAVVNRIAKSYRLTIDILIRVNPDFKLDSAAMRMTGVASQFGIDKAKMIENFNQVKKFKNVRVCGIQVYNGTRILDEQSIIENIRKILQLSDEIESLFSMSFNAIDLGGGFGVPYFDGEKKLNDVDIVRQLEPLFKKIYMGREKFEIILELGRYLIAESGYLITQVIAKKRSFQKNYLVLDAGMHCNHGISVQGAFIHKNFKVSKLYQNKRNKTECYQLVGPSCSPGDVLARDVILPSSDVGDYLVFHSVGAYGPTASPGWFISHGYPQEVMLKNFELQLIRRKESVNDLIKTQVDAIHS